MHDLKPFPAYRDSGVSWLGDAPAHWDVKRNKLLFREVNHRSTDGSEELLTVSQYNGVSRRCERMSDENGLLTNAASLVGYKRVARGDLVINIMLAWNSSLGVSPLDGIVSPAYSVFRTAQGLERRYYHYLLRTPLFTGVFKMVSTGVVDSRLRLYPEVFFRLPSLVPPVAEQAAIVRFLDHADRQIRRYIRAKQKLIKLLEEQKQAIIHRAVTRGVDPHARLKPSGVEWLGEVPEHWEVEQLRRRWAVTDCKHLTVPFVEEGIPLASVREVQRFNLDLTTSKRTTLESYNYLVSGGRIPKRGDLIYCRNVSAGACAYVNTDETFAMGQDVCLIRSDMENQRYLNYYLHSAAMQEQLSAMLIGSTFNRINVSAIKSLTVALPSRTEQDEIVAYLDATLEELDRPTEAARREIALLREYRTRLIADVVTGKLDVRAAAANLSGGDLLDADVVELDEEPLETGETEDEDIPNLEEVEV